LDESFEKWRALPKKCIHCIILIFLKFLKMIILLTDGIQNTPPYQEGLRKAGEVLDNENIKVFGVLTGEEKNVNSLLNLCTNDQFIFQPDFLPELIETMNHEMEYYC
jgi:hypothetical protein